MWPWKNHTPRKTSPRDFIAAFIRQKIIYSSIYFSINDCTIFLKFYAHLDFRVHLDFHATNKMYELYGFLWLNFFRFSSKTVPIKFSSKNVPLLHRTDCTEQYNSAETKCLGKLPNSLGLVPSWEKKISLGFAPTWEKLQLPLSLQITQPNAHSWKCFPSKLLEILPFNLSCTLT